MRMPALALSVAVGTVTMVVRGRHVRGASDRVGHALSPSATMASTISAASRSCLLSNAAHRTCNRRRGDAYTKDPPTSSERI